MNKHSTKLFKMSYFSWLNLRGTAKHVNNKKRGFLFKMFKIMLRTLMKKNMGFLKIRKRHENEGIFLMGFEWKK